MRLSPLLVHPLMILNVAGIINFPFYSCKAGTHHYIATLLLGHSRPTTFYSHSDKRFTLTEWTHPPLQDVPILSGELMPAYSWAQPRIQMLLVLVSGNDLDDTKYPRL